MDVGFSLEALNRGIRREGEATAEKLLHEVCRKAIFPREKMADPTE
jgi:hypothetical protein